MKALVYHGEHHITLADVPKPQLEKATDAIVRIVHTTICGTDLGILKGKNPEISFNEILQLVDGITPKVLSKELRDLEMHGFIERKVYPTMPVTVTYETTPYSETLNGILRELGQWGEKHKEKVKQNIRDQNGREKGAEI
ncbi:MAG TPA: winged helix-turn-helix transcriptional regulator [Mucilaginibacter sp.]